MISIRFKFSSYIRANNTSSLLVNTIGINGSNSPPIKSGSRRAKAELKIHRNTIGELDLKNNLIRINCELKRGPIEDHETHNVRYFDLDELRSLMLQTCFEKINFSIFGDIEQAPNKNTWQAMAWSKAV